MPDSTPDFNTSEALLNEVQDIARDYERSRKDFEDWMTRRRVGGGLAHDEENARAKVPQAHLNLLLVLLGAR